MRALAALVLMAACGQVIPVAEGPRLAASDVLVVVAHQDDDLLFMQPDLTEDVKAGRSVTIIDVTAGDATNGIDYVEARQRAQMAAYGVLAGGNMWSCEGIDLAGHVAVRCQLASAPVTIVFLGYPDGGIGGEFPSSLLKLWEGTVPSATTIARVPATYDRDGLIATVADIVTATSPRVIRTLDISGTHDSDHTDHMIVGALTVIATAQAASDARLIAYRGYNTASEPPNTADVVVADASIGYRAYQACMTDCGVACGTGACSTITDARFDSFVHRRYAVSRRVTPLAGALRSAGRCLVADPSGALLLDDCAGGNLAISTGAQIQIGDRCLQGDESGTVFATDCLPIAQQRWLVDDEGHVFLGMPAAPAPRMDYDHTLCLAPDVDGVRVARCGSQLDARWQLVRPPVATPDATIALSRSGRARRLADVSGDGLADLCSVELGVLTCALGDGTGGFAPAAPIDTTLARFAVEPESLVLGDVDGDGRADACGRSTNGIACELSTNGYTPAPFSTAFARTGTANLDDRSLAIVDGEICGHSADGAVCATADDVHVLSKWPQPGTLVWPAALDGDGTPDWCMATSSGPQCGVSTLAPLTTDGVPWGFSQRAQVEGSQPVDGPIECNKSALADIDGDGRADLCIALGGTIACARAQDNGFGPRTTMLTVPTKITALWLGDLDGDGRADTCVDDGTNVTCALSP
ncbi:MAG: VCBS repeat-containing protein [Deltaproteobacteria bacterium]|nr:VCBS repeat-containing protein [Deltaproteobacteria bacterium]